MAESNTKRVQHFDRLGDEIRSLVSLRVELEILQFLRRQYVDDHISNPSHHTPYGWPIEDCVRVYLHWLVKYPDVRFYQRRHGIPSAEIKGIVKFVISLSDGCPHLELTQSTSAERLAMSFVPPLPQDLIGFSDCTLFVDGIDYARTAKGLEGADDHKKWYSYKIKGPGFRSLVSLSNSLFLVFRSTALHNLIISDLFILQLVYNRRGLVEWATTPKPAGAPDSGERELLDNSHFFDVFMDQTNDKLFADGGYFGYPTRHPSFRFSIPFNKVTRLYTRANAGHRQQMDDFNAKHKRFGLSFVERHNRETRRFHIVSAEVKFRHSVRQFISIHKHVLALTNARLREHQHADEMME